MNLTRAFLLGPLVGVLSVGTACSSADDALGTTSETESALTADVDCSAESEPAYSGGQQIGSVDVVKIGEKRVAMKTAHAFLYLRQKAEEEGISVSINSGFRTMSEQEYFYNCYKTGSCNNGNLAARPGYSNHQNGRALDLGGDRSALNGLIKRLGLDWRRTVPSEAWHYEYYGPWVDGPCGTSNGAPTTDAPTTPTSPTTPTTPSTPTTPTTPVVDDRGPTAAPTPTVTPAPSGTGMPDGYDPFAPAGVPPVTNPTSPYANVDPYDQSTPYDPYRTPGGSYPTDTSTPGSIPTMPNGTSPTPSGTGLPTTTTAAPGVTPGASAPAPTPRTPVVAAPEAESRAPTTAPTTPSTVTKKSKNKAHAIESGCSIGTTQTSTSAAWPLALVGLAFVRRRRAARSGH